MRLIPVLALALLLCACGDINDDFTGTNIMQRTVQPGTAATLTLAAGDTLTIPADAFDRETVVLFADVFTGTDANPATFPTATKAAADLIGAVVINTPVDRSFGSDLPLTFDIIKPGESRIPSAVSAGQRYIVYRFDFDLLAWTPWGSTVATVAADGETATTTLPTAGFSGFIGSLALFEGQLAD